MTADLDTLLRDLQALARHDPGLTVFGATMHQWVSHPLDPLSIARFEEAHGVALPEAYRRWLTLAGPGAGPFYGLEPLPTEGAPGATFDGTDPSAGAARLSNQGCGYFDLLVLTGPHAGEVWVDFREGDGPLVSWYPSFEAWLAAWIRRSQADWAANVLGGGTVPRDADRAFLAACRTACEAVLAGTDDPMQAQYPIGDDRLYVALGMLELAAGRFEAAEAAFESGATASRDTDGMRAVGQCLVAEARGDAIERLAAADRGLAGPTWWMTRLQLLRHRRFALEALERWDEALEALVAIAQHAPSDLFAQYDLAWVRLLRGETALAADLLITAAERGVSCDRSADLPTRLDQVSAGLRQALRGAGQEAEAAALEAALGH